MEITDYRSLEKIIVSDGNEIIALAKRTGMGPWILRLYRASWADTATNTAKHDNAKRMRFDPFAFPYLKTVDTKSDAMSEMKALAKSILGEIPEITKR